MCTTARGLPCPGQGFAHPCDFTYIWGRREHWCNYCSYYLCASEAACVAAAKALWAACHKKGLGTCTGAPGCPGHL